MRIALNIVSSYARFLVGIVAVFFLTPFILNTVGVEAFGLWSLCLAVTGVLALLDLGFSTAAVKYVAECAGSGDFDARNEAVSTLFLVYAALGAVALILVWTAVPAGIRLFSLSPAEGEQFRVIMRITGVAVGLALPLSLFRSALIGQGRYDLVNTTELAGILLNVVLVVSLLKMDMGLTGLAIANASVVLSGPLIMIPLAFRKIPELHLSPRRIRSDRLREVSPLAIYFMLANIALLVTLRSDAIVIKAFLPLASVAAYAIAAKVSEYAYLLNKQFSNALMPLVSKSSGAGDHETVRAVLLDGTRYLMMIAAPLLALLFFHAQHIVYVWVGPELHAVVYPMRILLVAVFFSTLQFNAANVLGMTGGHRTVAFAMVASAIVNIALSIWLIPILELAGAAIATLTAAIVLEFGFILTRACRDQGLAFGRVLWGVVPVLLPLAPVMWLAWIAAERWPVDSLLDLVLHGGVAALLYFLIAALVAIKPSERQWVTERVSGLLSRRQGVGL